MKLELSQVIDRPPAEVFRGFARNTTGSTPMTPDRLSIGLSAICLSLVVLTGCGRLAPGRESQASPAGSPQVAPSIIAAVSLSAPSADAARAMELCGVWSVGTAYVAGMGLVSRARDVPQYVRLIGVEPEIQTDDPAWVIQFRGELMGRRGTLIDPTCVVIDDQPTMFDTGGSILAGGERITPLPVPVEPRAALPPLAP